jgi:flagellar hook assembly protein FlgD
VLLHESFHVAGVPAKPIDFFVQNIMEAEVHQVEASVGLPLSQIVLKIASIESVEAQGQGLAFTVNVTDPDQVDEDIIRVEILDGNRNLVFLQERPRAKLTERFTWNGLNASGNPTESGLHSIRVVAGSALYAGRDYVLKRAKG